MRLKKIKYVRSGVDILFIIVWECTDALLVRRLRAISCSPDWALVLKGLGSPDGLGFC